MRRGANDATTVCSRFFVVCLFIRPIDENNNPSCIIESKRLAHHCWDNRRAGEQGQSDAHRKCGWLALLPALLAVRLGTRYPFQKLRSYRFPESIPVTSIPAFTQQSVRYHVAARNVPNVEMCVHCPNDFATKWIASELVVIRKHFSFQRNCDDDANYLIGEHSPSNNECAK